MKDKKEQKEFVFFSKRMIQEMNKKVIKKGLEIEFANKAKKGLKDKSILW